MMERIRLFTGWDEREAVGWHVFCQSALERASAPVEITAITPAVARSVGLDPARSNGTNWFTRSRFLVPHLCGYEGWAIFADGVDMLCRADIAELWRFKDQASAPCEVRKDLWCVKHNYKSRFLRKYEGTEMEADNRDYDRKNWASLFLVNCASPFARLWHPELIERTPLIDLLQLSAWHDDRIGSLPAQWNWLVGEYGEDATALIAHYTLGIPGFARYRSAAFADDWCSAFDRSCRGFQVAPISER